MINSSTDKIKAIKALRAFSLETFGVVSGLKESKDLVESIIKEEVERKESLELANCVRKIQLNCPSHVRCNVLSYLKEVAYEDNGFIGLRQFEDRINECISNDELEEEI